MFIDDVPDVLASINFESEGSVLSRLMDKLLVRFELECFYVRRFFSRFNQLDVHQRFFSGFAKRFYSRDYIFAQFA